MALSSVFSMFAKSPIRPIQKHMRKALYCTQELMPFLESVLSQNWEAAEMHLLKISEMERQADILKKDLRLSLPKGIFLPVPRNDLLALLAIQEKVANKAEDIAGLMYGRRMIIPDVIVDQFKTYLQRAIDASEQANTAINELDELLETGFSGREVDLVEEMIYKLDRIESDTDHLQIEIRQKLFKIENDLPPVEVMFLYKIIESIGVLADQAQQVGERLQVLLAH